MSNIDYMLYKQSLIDLHDPLLTSDKLLNIFDIYQHKLQYILQNEHNLTDAITYFKLAFDEILEFDNKNEMEDKLFILVKVADKYLSITDKNVLYLQSTYTIIQAFLKAIIHQIWQRLFFMFKNKPLTYEDINEVVELFADKIGSIIINAKNYEMNNM